MTTKLPEDGPPWHECPHPERWTCWTPQGVECEVAQWLVATVQMLKPDVVLDTGTYVGTSAVHLAEGCRRNGAGHVWTQDVDGTVLNVALASIEAANLEDWVSVRKCGSVVETCELIGQPVDLAFIDADTPYTDTRARELAAVWPFLSDRAVVLAHDTSPAWGRWQVAAVRGYDMVHLPTPRGLTVLRVRL